MFPKKNERMLSEDHRNKDLDEEKIDKQKKQKQQRKRIAKRTTDCLHCFLGYGTGSFFIFFVLRDALQSRFYDERHDDLNSSASASETVAQKEVTKGPLFLFICSSNTRAFYELYPCGIILAAL